MTTPTATRTLAHIGDTLTHRAGRVVITLQRVNHDAYRVTTAYGSTGAQIDQWTCSYPNEAQARSEARRAAEAFADGATVEQLAERYDDLGDLVEANIRRRHPDATNRAIRYEKMRDAITPLAVRAFQDTLDVGVPDTIRTAA